MFRTAEISLAGPGVFGFCGRESGWSRCCGSKEVEGGMTDYAAARENMVESQLRPNRVTNPQLIQAMGSIPREKFVPSARSAVAYCDESIKLSGMNDETSSERHLMAPMTFGRLVQLAGITADDLVLDIGCGSGYSTAVLGMMAATVVALEESEEMAEDASTRLSEIGVDNAAVVSGPLAEGFSREGPYDAIMIQGAVEQVPEALLGQLKDGGRLVTIVSDGSIGRARLYRKSGESVSEWNDFDAAAEFIPGFEKPRGEFRF